jgi:GntR family transcriptional regulator/MocR family aminotransferase
MNFSFELKRGPGRPLYKVLAGELIKCIESGRLISGQTLPPSRELAESLGVSRYTVTRSYDELNAAGYVESRSTSGIFVRSGVRKAAAKAAAANASDVEPLSAELVSRYSARLLAFENLQPNPEYLREINFGAPPADLLPKRTWRQLLQKNLELDLTLLFQPDVVGRIELREALAYYFLRHKGIECPVDRVAVFSQSQNALNVIFRILFNEGDGIALEEPGFGGVRNIAVAQGMSLHAVPTDEEGLVTDALWNLPQSVRGVYVTPAHQDPCGAVMSLRRRQALIAWARARRAWLLEDDYDSFFNWGTRSVSSLTTLSGGEGVIYVGNFWKLLYPVSTVSFAILPPALCEVLRAAKTLTEPNFEALEQLALADYIQDGHLERQMRRFRKLYSVRRRTLIYHLKRIFGDSLEIDRRNPGTHILIYLSLSLDERTICTLAAQAGLGMVSTRNHYLNGAVRRTAEFLVDFSHLLPDNIAGAVEKFHRLLTAQR